MSKGPKLLWETFDTRAGFLWGRMHLIDALREMSWAEGSFQRMVGLPRPRGAILPCRAQMC